MSMKRSSLFVVGVLCAIATVAPSRNAAASGPRVGVAWHGQMAPSSGMVDGASAHLVRTPNGISYELHATQLTSGHAYTLWQVVVNNPAACAQRPCTARDIFQNPNADAQVSYAAGHVVGSSGKASFAGSQREGAIPEGWIADRGLVDAMAAEVHLVLNDHGPALAEFMPGMIHTYRGGCSDSSPFPAIFPASALADGEVGPNTCRLTQVAVIR